MQNPLRIFFAAVISLALTLLLFMAYSKLAGDNYGGILGILEVHMVLVLCIFVALTFYSLLKPVFVPPQSLSISTGLSARAKAAFIFLILSSFLSQLPHMYSDMRQYFDGVPYLISFLAIFWLAIGRLFVWILKFKILAHILFWLGLVLAIYWTFVILALKLYVPL